MGELDLVATTEAGIFAVGGAVAQHLTRRAFPRPFTTVIHYSGVAARARAAGVVGHEESFEQFRSSVSLDLVLATAEDVLNASVPASFRNETLARLAGSQLTTSRQQLIFNYKLTFEGWAQSQHRTGTGLGAWVLPTTFEEVQGFATMPRRDLFGHYAWHANGRPYTKKDLEGVAEY